IRATTLVNADNKERIIPNKRFVTDEITNWSLTNQIIRLVVSVKTAYNSDPRFVRDVLLKAVTDNNRVLEDPPPRVLLVAFADSGLQFDCRVYVKDISDWVTAGHMLHTELFEACLANGIEI